MKLNLPIGSNFKIRKKKGWETTKQMLTKFSLHRAQENGRETENNWVEYFMFCFLTRSGIHYASQKIRIGLKELKGDTGGGGRNRGRGKKSSWGCTDSTTGTCRMVMVIKLRESDVTGREISHQTQ